MLELGLSLAALAVLVVGAVLLARWRRRRGDDRLAGQWRELQLLRARYRGTAALAEVGRVRLRAPEGTRATIIWTDTGFLQDSWFPGHEVESGARALIRTSPGWGPHTTNAQLFPIGPSELLYLVPPGAEEALERHRLRRFGRA